jgi:hypothetical protein
VPKDPETWKPLTFEERLAALTPEQRGRKKLVDERNRVIASAGKEGKARAIYGGRVKREDP